MESIVGVKLSQKELGRGDFMNQPGEAALLAGPAVQAARGANGKVNIGWIGLGTRGYYCLDKMYAGNAKNVHVGAVCDTFTGHLARGKDRVQTVEGEAPKALNDYRDILADPSIDTVFIMTPEHLHYPMMMAALKPGKNIYVEKPLAHTIEQRTHLGKAAEQSGKVVQVGTQNRSSTLYNKAKEMYSQAMPGQ